MSKELVVEKVVNSSLYKVKFAGGGELPKALQGHYTSIPIAQRAIENYLSSRTEKKPNGKTKDSKGV